MSADDPGREALAASIADAGGAAAGAPGDDAMALIAGIARGFAAVSGAEDAPPPPERWGPLELRGPLGEGTFGQVYVAWDPALQREVALKLRRPAEGGDAGSTARWLEEGRRLARVRHPNVLTVHGADEHDGRAGLWTDLVAGRSLEDLLALGGPLSAREAAVVGSELCAALAAVHGAGLVHGDVKSRNVLRASGDARGGEAGRVVLVDFGAASDASRSGGALSHGTPPSLSPERLAGAPASAAADLWALGALLFRLVTGRHPYDADSLEDLRERSARGERLRLLDVRPDLPRAFVAIVERALAQDPRARYATAAAFEDALAGFLSARASRTNRVPWLVGGLAAAVALAWFALAPRHAATPAPPAAPAPVVAAVVAPAAVAPPVAESAATAPARAIAAPVVDATLLRWREGEAQPLVNGGRIRPGDRLSLELKTAEPLHVYVLDEDGRGEVTTLFPFAGGGLANPLPAAARVELPGTRSGDALRWLVTSAEGRESFLVVASRGPLAPIERAVAALPEVREGEGVRYATLSDADLKGMRGVTGVIADSSGGAVATGRLAALARALAAGRAGAGAWWTLVRVENPSR